jgi:hypothetical protein
LVLHRSWYRWIHFAGKVYRISLDHIKKKLKAFNIKNFYKNSLWQALYISRVEFIAEKYLVLCGIV